jgi:hypothetical protein
VTVTELETETETGVRSLRRAVSDRLLRAGARLALDRQEIWRRGVRAGTRPQAADLHALGAMDLSSAVALRLGFLLMPAQPPDLRRDPAAGVR